MVAKFALAAADGKCFRLGHRREVVAARVCRRKSTWLLSLPRGWRVEA